MIEYRESAAGITSEMLPGFFVGWPNPPSPTTHLKILKQSSHIVLAFDTEQNRVVGFINAISDNILCAYIPLLEVLPEFKNLGIGGRLTATMLEKLKRFYMIDLICNEELQPFYKRFGMGPYSGMVIRNFKRQSGE